MASTLKYIERRIRRTVLRRLKGGRRDVKLPPQLPPRPRLLLIRTDRIGDAIISTPSIALLRQRFPEARIDLLLGHRNALVGGLIPGVDRVIVLPRSPVPMFATISHLRRQRYDVAINLLEGDSASAAAVTAASGARYRVGFDGQASSAYEIVVERPSPEVHMVPATAALLGALGVDPIPPEGPRRPCERLQLRIAKQELSAGRQALRNAVGMQRGAVVVMNVSASAPSRRWAIDRFETLADRMRTAGFVPVFVGAPADESALRSLAQRGWITLAPSRSYARFASLLAGADAVVTADSSVVHLAAALERPLVVLARSSGDTRRWAPWGVAHRIVADAETLAAIAPDDVFPAISSLLTDSSQ